MPKTYSFERLVNLKRITGIDMFENTKFGVQGCATPAEAQKDIEDWIVEYIVEGKKKIEEAKQKQMEALRKQEEDEAKKPPFESETPDWGGKDSIVNEEQKKRHLDAGGKEYKPKKVVTM